MCTSGCNNIAKWNGKTWSALGTGLLGPDWPEHQPIAVGTTTVYAWPYVKTIAVSGHDLYAGGYFVKAGNCTSGCNSIAKWDGKAWSALGTGMPGVQDMVFSIIVNGNDLYAGGWFTSAGTCTLECNNIAKWNGRTWSPLGTGVSGLWPSVDTIAFSGSSVYAAGGFGWAGTCTSGCNHLAKWNGSAWTSLGLETDEFVSTLVSSGSTVYMGGEFKTSVTTCPDGSAGGMFTKVGPPCQAATEWKIIALK
jgi:hypothetical protein